MKQTTQPRPNQTAQTRARQAAQPRRNGWPRALLFAVLLPAIAFACLPRQLPPTPGLRAVTSFTRVPVPGGHVNAAGGNYLHQRVDLALDTRLGPFAIGAVYNSSAGWLTSVDVTYRHGTLRDETGASFVLATLLGGDAAPGSHWVKLDATRVKTKGGLLHEFDAVSGRLLTIRWSSSPYPRLRFVQTKLGAVWRASAVEQCTSAVACTPVFSLVYDASARLVRIDDRAGRSALFSYDAAGKLVAARDGLDVAKGWPGERYSYAGNFLTSLTSSEGERVELTSDAQGRTLEVRAVGAGDPTHRFAYGHPDPAGVATTTVSDPLGNGSSFAIDSSARLLSTTNALGERTQLSWAGLRPASRTLPDGTRTSWTWAHDDLASETLPSGNTRTFTYQADAVDRALPLARPLRTLSDSLGLVEQRAYDASGRLASVANGLGEATSFSYGADQALATVTAPDGSSLRFTHTGEHGHAAFAIYGSSAPGAAFSYDAVGNLLRSTAPDPRSGGVKQRRYDADRNVAALELLDGPASGAPTLETLHQEHRSDGQLLHVTRPFGGASRFEYDALGRLVAIAEQASPGAVPQPGTESVTSFERDALGRVTATTRANGMREETEYDAAGRAVRMRTLRSGVVESDVAFTLAAGRLVRARDAGAFDEAFAYDAAGRLAEVTHSLGERTRLVYDARSRQTRSELLLPGAAPLATLLHGYDLADRETSLAYLGVSLIARRYVGGKLDTTHYGNGLRRSEFRSTQTGRASGRELWRGSQRVEKSDYTLAEVPGGETLAQRTQLSDGGAADGVTREAYAYATLYPGHAAMERRVGSTALQLGGGAAAAELFRYDQLSNLLESSGPGGALALRYNAERNRLLSAERAPTGPFVPVLTSGFEHDAAGFVSSETMSLASFPLASNAFTWNARGQLIAIHTDGALAVSLSYDALGRRRERVLGASVTRWRFGGVVETDAADRPVAIDLGEVRIALQPGSQRLYRHPDLRRNPKLVTNETGRVVRHNAFGAYGQLATLGSQSDGVGFAGGTPIATGGAQYVLIGARLYAPQLARFLTPDPVWNAVNPYAYTFGNPVDYWDPSGLAPESAKGLTQTSVSFAGKIAIAIGAGIAFSLAAPGLATVAAGFALAGALLFVIEEGIGLYEEIEERQREPRLRTGARESRGAGADGSGGGGLRSGGIGGDRSSRSFEVCSDDGTGPFCTRSGGGWSQPPRFHLY